MNHKSQNLNHRFNERANSMVSAPSEHRGPEPWGRPTFVVKIDKSGKIDISYKIYTISSQLMEKESIYHYLRVSYMLETVLKIW